MTLNSKTALSVCLRKRNLKRFRILLSINLVWNKLKDVSVCVCVSKRHAWNFSKYLVVKSQQRTNDLKNGWLSYRNRNLSRDHVTIKIACVMFLVIAMMAATAAAAAMVMVVWGVRCDQQRHSISFSNRYSCSFLMSSSTFFWLGRFLLQFFMQEREQNVCLFFFSQFETKSMCMIYTFYSKREGKKNTKNVKYETINSNENLCVRASARFII